MQVLKTYCNRDIKVKYEGRLISNAHSEIFCQRSIVVMRG